MGREEKGHCALFVLLPRKPTKAASKMCLSVLRLVSLASYSRAHFRAVLEDDRSTGCLLNCGFGGLGCACMLVSRTTLLESYISHTGGQQLNLGFYLSENTRKTSSDLKRAAEIVSVRLI